MKHNILFIALIGLAILTGCNKSNSEPKKALNADFIGSYTLSIDYIFVGEEDEDPSTGSWKGSMEITANGDTNVVVTSQIEIKDGVSLDLYHTTGYVNDQGQLVLAPNEYDNGSYVFYISYSPFKYSEPLRFDSEMFVDISGYPTTYTIDNFARKKQ